MGNGTGPNNTSLTAGVTSLVKTGSGTFTLQAPTPTAAARRSAAARWPVAGAGVLGSGNYTAAIADSGALVLNTGTNQTLGGVISGNGAVFQLGSNQLILSNANTYGGGTTVNSGIVQVTNGVGVGLRHGGIAADAGLDQRQ